MWTGPDQTGPDHGYASRAGTENRRLSRSGSQGSGLTAALPRTAFRNGVPDTLAPPRKNASVVVPDDGYQ